jgi:predicted ribosome quality control (RQC) complex YloA/Tae2 family protein
MKELSSLEIRAIVTELQEFVDGKIDNVYQPDGAEVVLSLYKTEVGRKYLRILPGVAFYLAKRKRKSPQHQLNFCRFLRKRIKGAFIEKLVQKGFERIIEIHLRGREENFIFICEFFSKGNVILCNEEYTIISAIQVQLWKDRKIKAREKYVYPPSRPIYYDDYNNFALHIERSEKSDIVRKLATLNLGGLYAEEVCYRAGVNKDSTQVGERELKRLFTKMQDVLHEPIMPRIVNGHPVPIQMESLGEGDVYAHYSDALDKYYEQFIEDFEELEIKETETKVDKYSEILRQQEVMVDGVSKSIGENKDKGDWIYANYGLIQDLLKLYKQNNHNLLSEKGVRVEATEIIIDTEK